MIGEYRKMPFYLKHTLRGFSPFLEAKDDKLHRNENAVFLLLLYFLRNQTEG